MAQDAFVGPLIEKEAGGDVLRVKTGGQLVGERIERKPVSMVLPSATALSTVVPGTVIVNPELPMTVKSVRWVSQADLAGHATSNTTISVNKISALATATTTIASLTFTTTNAATAYIPKTLTLTTSAVSVAAGESVVAKYSFASSGQDTPIATVTVDAIVDAV